MFLAIIAVVGVIFGIMGLKKPYKKLSIAIPVMSGVLLAFIIFMAVCYWIQGV